MISEPSAQKNLYAHCMLLDELIKLYKEEKLPNKFIFSGTKGIGKSILAYHLINYVLSEDEELSYDHNNYKINSENKTFKLIQNRSNPNFFLIDIADDRKYIEINQIRELINNLNKSSFNKKKRFVLIDNIELLNINAISALLKILEEPNTNIIFILINNNKRIPLTIKSRCIEFKVFLTKDQNIELINKILNDNVYNLVNDELIDNYITPGKIFEILKFSEEFGIDIKNTNLNKLLILIIQNKFYKKNKSYSQLTYTLIELYFRKNITVKSKFLMYMYDYFINKINDVKTYNLDEESLFIEFKEKILNE